MVNTEITLIIFFAAKDGEALYTQQKTRPGADCGSDYELLIAKFRFKLKKVGKTTGEGNGKPLHYSCLENPMDGGAWWVAVHGIAKSRTRLSNFTEWSSGFPYFLPFKSEFGNKEFMM